MPLSIYSDGFSTSTSPSLFISNTPISFVEPKRFLTPRSILYDSYLSPSKYSTVSTICSKVRGPATAPSFVTCPTIKIDISNLFAICIRTAVASLTCDTLPGADATSSLYIVCIESIITIDGFSFSITFPTISRFVSHNSFNESVKFPILSALILIWFKDSSPDTYKTGTFCSAAFLHICNKSVDFPIPGSPPTSTSDPFTIPPPSTRSSSFIPVINLSSSDAFIFEIGKGCALFLSSVLFPDELTDFLSIFSSTNVFHSLHAGHCPIHFADS